MFSVWNFSGSIFGIFVLKTQSGVLPFLVFTCVHLFENLVSVHNFIDSTDLGEPLILWTLSLFLGLFMQHGSYF